VCIIRTSGTPDAQIDVRYIYAYSQLIHRLGT